VGELLPAKNLVLPGNPSWFCPANLILIPIWTECCAINGHAKLSRASRDVTSSLSGVRPSPSTSRHTTHARTLSPDLTLWRGATSCNIHTLIGPKGLYYFKGPNRLSDTIWGHIGVIGACIGRVDINMGR
jgi:hypothetical protein